MDSTVKSLLENPGLTIVVLIIPAFLTLSSSLILEGFKWWLQHHERKQEADRPVSDPKPTIGPEQNIGKRVQHNLVWVLFALLLTVPVILFAPTRLLFIVLYFGVFIASLLRAFRIVPYLKSHLRVVVAFLVLVIGLAAAGIVSALRLSDRIGFDVLPAFTGLMVMGDLGDITIVNNPGGDRFVYVPAGRGKHEWDFKYIDGNENPEAAKFAGVMFIKAKIPAKPGATQDDGADIRCCTGRIVWEACSLDGPASVNFVIGGITWAWNEQTKQIYALQYGDSLANRRLGTRELGKEWRKFEFDLQAAGLNREDFRRVIGGFGWTMSWPNGHADPGKTFTIQIRNVRYLR